MPRNAVHRAALILLIAIATMSCAAHAPTAPEGVFPQTPRDTWQRPQEIIAAMAIEPGMTIADLGAGIGYFIPYLRHAVGPQGKVIAIDIEQALLDHVAQDAELQGWTNVDTLLAAPHTSNLEPASVDRIIAVNTWHHITNRREYAGHMRDVLKPGGELWVVDNRPDAPQGPPADHRIDPALVISELEAGGLRAELHPLELDRQFVIVARHR